jgi:hypothetical protein
MGNTTGLLMDSGTTTASSKKNDHTNLVFAAENAQYRDHFTKTTNRATYQPPDVKTRGLGARQQLIEKQLLLQVIEYV